MAVVIIAPGGGEGGGGPVDWTDVTNKPTTFTPSTHSHAIADTTGLQAALDAKQDTLVSGTNIKTINSTPLLGAGDIAISGTLADGDYGDITVGGTGTTMTIDNDAVTDAKLRNSAGLSIIGRSANSTGDPADIVGADGEVLRVNGTTLGFGTVASAGIADGAITDAKIRDAAALSVLGRSSNTSGDVADIAAATDGFVLRRSGATLGFGTVATDGIANAAVTNDKILDGTIGLTKIAVSVFPPETHTHPFSELEDFNIDTPVEGQLLAINASGEVINTNPDLSVFANVSEVEGADGDYLRNISGVWTPVSRANTKVDLGIPATDGTESNIIFSIEVPENGTYVLHPKASFPFTIDGLDIETTSGTCTVAVKIGSTAVTGLSAVSVSSTQANPNASAANSVVAGNKVNLEVSSNSSAAKLVGVLRVTRG
jgi:hypothetical protein